MNWNFLSQLDLDQLQDTTMNSPEVEQSDEEHDDHSCQRLEGDIVLYE